MDYLSNLLIGPTNKLKTTGIILGSVCVGIIGIVSAAFISYGVIQSVITDSIIPNTIIPFTISSPTPNVSIISKKFTPFNSTYYSAYGANLTNSSSYGFVTVSSFVRVNSSVQYDIFLPFTTCSDLQILTYTNDNETNVTEYDISDKNIYNAVNYTLFQLANQNKVGFENDGSIIDSNGIKFTNINGTITKFDNSYISQYYTINTNYNINNSYVIERIKPIQSKINTTTCSISVTVRDEDIGDMARGVAGAIFSVFLIGWNYTVPLEKFHELIIAASTIPSTGNSIVANQEAYNYIIYSQSVYKPKTIFNGSYTTDEMKKYYKSLDILLVIINFNNVKPLYSIDDLLESINIDSLGALLTPVINTLISLINTEFINDIIKVITLLTTSSNLFDSDSVTFLLASQYYISGDDFYTITNKVISYVVNIIPNLVLGVFTQNLQLVIQPLINDLYNTAYIVLSKDIPFVKLVKTNDGQLINITTHWPNASLVNTSFNDIEYDYIVTGSNPYTSRSVTLRIIGQYMSNLSYVKVDIKLFDVCSNLTVYNSAELEMYKQQHTSNINVTGTSDINNTMCSFSLYITPSSIINGSTYFDTSISVSWVMTIPISEFYDDALAASTAPYNSQKALEAYKYISYMSYDFNGYLYNASMLALTGQMSVNENDYNTVSREAEFDLVDEVVGLGVTFASDIVASAAIWYTFNLYGLDLSYIPEYIYLICNDDITLSTDVC